MPQNWLNTDGLFIQYGTDKTVPETFGDFMSYGENRIVEGLITLSTLTSTAAIQSYTTFFGAPPTGQMYIEKVEAIAEEAALSGTSFSVGLIQQDQSTIPASYSTAFINAMTVASMTPAGKYLMLTNGSSFAGGLIGTQPANATGPYYITALAAGTFTTGKIRVRIHYRGIGVITQ